MTDELRFERLNDENYREWKVYMEATLIRKLLWGYVEGTEEQPEGEEGTKKVKEFRTKQLQARAEIILNVTPLQLPHCASPDPAVIWSTLADIHASRGRSTIITLRRQLHKLRLERSESMPSYIARARTIVHKLIDAGHHISDDDLLLAITAGLPHFYDPFLVSIDTLSDSEYTLELIIPRLINEFTRQSARNHARTPVTNASDDAMIVTADGRRVPLSEVTCYRCGRKGHYQSNCPSLKRGHIANTVEALELEDDDDASF